MIEKNFDPDNENCPEKETVEHLFKLKHESDNFQTIKEFENSINDVQNNETEHLEKKENWYTIRKYKHSIKNQSWKI